jgi:DNA-binding response OmpR family regulator
MPHKILVVDDDNATVLGLVELFRGAGYQSVGVSTLAAGRKALVDEAPDLLIADVRLAEFNGLQLIITSPRPIPVIVVTGFPDPAIEAEARRLGAAFLLKPVDPAELLRLVARKLAATTREIASRPTRRWARRPVTRDMAAHIDNSGPARILDVSYGGLRLEIRGASAASLPASFGVTFPGASLTVEVAVVWQKPTDDAGWVCGAMVRDDQSEWRQLVDAVS